MLLIRPSTSMKDFVSSVHELFRISSDIRSNRIFLKWFLNGSTVIQIRQQYIPGKLLEKPSMSASTSISRCRQNFTDACETGINDQINMEFGASYVYQSMAAYLAHDSVALPGLSAHFRKEAEEERSHALKFVDYLVKRGGVAKFANIKAPTNVWKSAREILEAALDLEKAVNASLLKLHALADESNDPHLADYIEEEFLNDQVESLKEISDLITQLDRCGNEGLGLYLFDQKMSS